MAPGEHEEAAHNPRMGLGRGDYRYQVIVFAALRKGNMKIELLPYCIPIVSMTVQVLSRKERKNSNPDLGQIQLSTKLLV